MFNGIRYQPYADTLQQVKVTKEEFIKLAMEYLKKTKQQAEFQADISIGLESQVFMNNTYYSIKKEV